MTDDIPALPCYLNGEYSNLREAKVSVLDRGFIFGDAVYEGIPAYGGRLFRFDEHMARLSRGLAEMRIVNPRLAAEWKAIAIELIAAHARQLRAPAGNDDYFVYLHVTRGVAMRDHVMPQGLAPTVFAMATPMKPPTAQQRAEGVACVTAEDFRWQKANIKCTSLAGAVLSRQLSADVGAVETVMFRGGNLSEAAASNVWLVKNGVVIGTPADNLVLRGVRYGLVEQLCHDAGIAFELRRVSRNDVLAADELLLSSATKEVLAITQLDGQPVGNGRPGPIYDKLYAGYQRAKQTDTA